jgi:hypothetical protein
MTATDVSAQLNYDFDETAFCEVRTDLYHVIVYMQGVEIEIIQSITGFVYITQKKVYDDDENFEEEWDPEDSDDDDMMDDWNRVNEEHAWNLECESRFKSNK